MVRRFIIHIGPPKTGTSSLQQALFDHRDLLAAHGIEYPAFGRHRMMPRLPGHHGIAGNLSKGKPIPDEVKAGLAALDDDITVILSSEDFSHLSAAAIRQFMDQLEADNIQVVYYARRWDHLLPSVWTEQIKHGHSFPYLEYLNRQISSPGTSVHLNYMIPLDKWSSVVGKPCITVFSYDNIRDSGSDIVEHFFSQVLDVPLEPRAGRRENTRQTAALTEIMRMLNLLSFKTGTPTPRVRMSLMRHLPRVEPELNRLEAMLENYKAEAQFAAPAVFADFEQQFLGQYAGRVANLTSSGRLFGNDVFDPAEYCRQDYMFQTSALSFYRLVLNKIRSA